MKLFVDTETTGLPKRRSASYADVSNWPRLVQIAWILVDRHGRELTSAEHIIRPAGFTIPNEAAKIHGITTERAIAEGVSIARVLSDFDTAVTRAEIIVAHNVEYDRPVIEAEYIRENLHCAIGARQLICTMESSTNYCAIPGRYGYKWPTLNELHTNLFGEPFQNAHNALVDVRACMKCFFELEKRGVISPRNNKVAKNGGIKNVGDGDYAQELLDEVTWLAAEQEWFDSEFVESVAEQYDAKGYLTDPQIKALERIRDMLASR